MENSYQCISSFYNPEQSCSFSHQKLPYSSLDKKQVQIHEITTKEEAFSIIFDIYLNQGAEWKLIKSRIGEKFVKDPKNFVYNSLRKATRILQQYESQGVQQKRRMSKNDTIISLIEVVNHIQKQFSSENKTLSQESPLFKLKKNILMLSIWEDSFSTIQIAELLKEIKKINSKIKSLGVFKAKHKRNWKITEKGFELLKSLDHTISNSRVQQGKANETTIGQLQYQEEAKQNLLEDIDLPEFQYFYIEQRKYETSLINEANMILGVEEDSYNYFF